MTYHLGAPFPTAKLPSLLQQNKRVHAHAEDFQAARVLRKRAERIGPCWEAGGQGFRVQG